MAKNKTPSNELTLTRLYDAPVETVWEAWTDPEQAAKWWGPRGFTITNHSKDLKVGGHWHYTMHGPDGTDYPNRTIYLEVDKYKRLVYDHGGYEDRPPLFRVTVLFEKQGSKTQMEMTMTWPTAEIATEMKKFIIQANGHSTWDRLAEHLAGSKRTMFVINRSFETSIENMFTLWTDPNHFSQWLGPAGSQLEFIKNEVGEGKTSFYKMTYDEGPTIYGKINYIKIQPPTYLEYAQWFCTEKGELARHPMAPHWPQLMLTRVQFYPEGDDQTRVNLTWEPQGEVTAEELKTFIEMKSGMNQGWTQSFDRLESYLN
jgi:uncharacterized protein YndB with AHSA1/START domain